jgi:hypothetical protein
MVPEHDETFSAGESEEAEASEVSIAGPEIIIGEIRPADDPRHEVPDDALH